MSDNKKLPLKRSTIAKLKRQKLYDPNIFLSPKRIDVAAKTIFARAYIEGNTSKWPEYVYREHIRAFNNFYEKEPSKNSFEDFKDSFIKTIEGVKNDHSWKHGAPVYRSKKGLVNGAHRVAASIVLNDMVNTVVPRDIYDDSYDYSFFKKDKNGSPGISDEVLDYVTIEYVSLKKKDIFIAIIFPTAEGYREEAYNHLVKLGSIVNMKTFAHNEFNGKEIIKQLYFNSKNDEWNYGLDFDSAQYKADLCFDGLGELQVYVIEANLDEPTRIKEKQYLRSLWKKDKHSIHVTDTIEEANRVVRMFFNANSRKFMKINRGQEFNSQKMYEMFNEYIELAPKNILEREKVAIEGSAVLDLFNIRSGKDIDYISRDNRINFQSNDIEKHNQEENQYHSDDIDEILTNPKYYFYYKGYKFIDILEIRKYKFNRLRNNDPKDKQDIKLIEDFINKYPVEYVRQNSARTKKPPLVSVIVPVYNTPAAYLIECLESIRKQVYQNLEIIIVDDGSVKNTAKKIDDYVTKLNQTDTRWNIVRQNNKGLSAARNAGYKSAHGEYVQFLDSDDLFDKQLIRRAVERAEDTGADIVIENFTAKNFATGEERVILQKKQLPPKSLFGLDDLGGNTIETIPYNVWSKLFRKEYLDKCAILHDESLRRSEDVLFTFTALLNTQKISAVFESHILYREDLPSSNSITNDKYPSMSVLAWRKLYELLVDNNCYEKYRDDYELSMLNSVEWHYNRLYTQEGKLELAIAVKKLLKEIDVRVTHDFRVVIELLISNPATLAIFEDKNNRIKRLEIDAQEYRKKIHVLESRLSLLERPGMKLASRKLAGAVLRKLR